MSRKIDFIIGGAQKSSTSYLASVLTSNRNIYIPDGEVAYFQNPDYRNNDDEYLNKYFDNRDSEELWGIKRPSYLCNDESPGYIKDYKSDIKLIFVLRDPVERAISSLYHNMKYGFLPIENIADLIKKILSGELNGYPRYEEVLRYSFYYKHLKNWFRLFNDDQILLVTQEELIKNSEDVIRKISSFLGIDEAFSYKEPIFKKQETIYSLSRLKWVSIRNSFKFTYNQNNTRLYPKKNNIFNSLTYNFITGVDRLVLKPIIGNNKNIPAESKELLIKVFESDVEKLEQKLPSIRKQWKNFASK